MKRLSHTIPIFAALLSLSAHAEDVIWNYNGQAIATGTGCDPTNAMVLTAGNEVTVVLTEISVNLGDEFAPNSARINCTVRIPVKIARGLYIGEVKHVIRYGITKSRNASGSFSARLAYLDAPALSFEDRFPVYQRMDEPIIERVLSGDFRAMREKWCGRSTDTAGAVNLTLRLNASRSTTSEHIVIDGMRDGEGLRLEGGVSGVYNCGV